MKKVIFDTDIGIDDAMALLFLHYSPAVDLRAIVTGFGNASVETTTRNALYTHPGTRIEPYWPFKGRQIASTWVALTACDEDSSAAQFVRGSHAWGKVFRPMAFSKEGGSSEFLGDNAAYEEYRISTQHPVTTRSSAGTCNPATRSYSVPKSFTVRNKTRIRRDDEPPCQSGTSVMMPDGIPRKEPILS